MPGFKKSDYSTTCMTLQLQNYRALAVMCTGSIAAAGATDCGGCTGSTARSGGGVGDGGDSTGAAETLADSPDSAVDRSCAERGKFGGSREWYRQ